MYLNDEFVYGKIVVGNEVIICSNKKINQNFRDSKYKGTITVKQIMDEIAVSDMTARRYLQELADKDLLIRVHGGAEKLRTNSL